MFMNDLFHSARAIPVYENVKIEKICVKQAKHEIEIHIYNNMSNIYRSMYFRILCSLFCKYVPVCHPSDQDINWSPPVQEETFPMQVKEHNNLHDYFCLFIRQTSVFNYNCS